MIREVHKDRITYNDAPMKFEAGTPGIVQTIGLGVALDYMMDIGMENIAAHEDALRDYTVQKLGGLNWLQVQGTTADKGAIFSFTIDGAAHAHDISTILGSVDGSHGAERDLSCVNGDVQHDPRCGCSG